MFTDGWYFSFHCSATLKRSCEELYLAGERRTGVWALDIDGSGPLGTSYVYCRLSGEGERRPGEVRARAPGEDGEEARVSAQGALPPARDTEDPDTEPERYHGITEVTHNLRPETRVRGPELNDHKKIIKYRCAPLHFKVSTFAACISRKPC